MDPKLLRQYSDIIGERIVTPPPAQPTTTAPVVRTGQGPKPATTVGSGASGFPLQTPAGQGSKPTVKPAVNPYASQVAAARKADAQQQAMTPRGDQTAGGNTNANFLPGAAGGAKPATVAPTPTPTASAPVDASVGAGQSLAAMGAAQKQQDAQADFQKLSGMTPTVTPTATATDSGQGAKPATSSVPPGLASATTPQGQGAKPAPSTTGMPSGLASAVTPQGSSVGGETPPTSGGSAVTGGFGQETNMRTRDFEEDLEGIEEELEEMMRLSGISLNEKAVSKQQQKFMGMVHAMQKGEKVKGASPELKKVAKTMGKKDAKDFASTKHKGLPQKVSESIMLEAGSNLEHIVTRFKHETKNFLNGAELDEDLYNALYDYYIDNGEMPYGVAKAREGDPYQWVSQHFEDELAMMGHQRQFQETVIPVVDNQLSELARLAGLSESQIDECGDMGMQQDNMSVSTNMSSDGKKNVTISAEGDQAEALLQMLKLAGMGHIGHSGEDDKPMLVVSKDEEMMDEEYANGPEEEYQSVASITRQGNDLNREKRQYADKPKLGDNPMAEEVELDEELASLLDSVLVREEDPRRPKGDTGQAEIFTADLGINPPSPDEGPVGRSKLKAPAAPKSPQSPALPRPGVKK